MTKTRRPHIAKRPDKVLRETAPLSSEPLNTSPTTAGWLAACAAYMFFATSCTPCPPTVSTRATSPNGAVTAVAFSRLCGPVPPVNEHVELVTRDGRSDEVLEMLDTPFGSTLRWEGQEHLVVTIDCPFSGGECELPRNRSWDISAQRKSGRIRISYELGPRLSQSPDAKRVLDALE